MIVRLNGGLANQLFQYAFGRSVAKARGEELFFKTQDLGRGCHRFFGLDAFRTEFALVEGPVGPCYDETRFRYDPGVYTAAPGLYYRGCWQTEKYFDEELVRKELTLRNFVSEETKRVANNILKRPSAFVHIRRTDYLKPHAVVYHGNLSMDYYRAAMDRIEKENPGVIFYIFSDDPEWCRVHITDPAAVIVGHNRMGSGDSGPGKEHEDLWLMSLCDHAIIANSSFSWFGAWLGDTRRPRTVIGPKQWFVTPTLESCDIMPERWIKL